jgi:ribosome biogenesis GTPase
MQENLTDGLVVRVTGGEVWVAVGDGELVSCRLRGKFRLRKREFQLVAGDRVSVRRPDSGGAPWTIEGLGERESWLSRFIERDTAERVMVANITRLYVVATLESPPLHYGFIDRVLVAAEFGHVRSSIVLNKIDLSSRSGMEPFVALYESCGYPVLKTSALTGEGVDLLSATLGDGVYAFVGESGVGKSSLLMSIDPDLELKTRAVGDKTGRGRHTTSFSQLYEFGRGFLADTPGVQTFGFSGTDATALPDCFPEFGEHVDNCRFRPCSHSHEPDCGVKAALDRGLIHDSRYRSYLNILAEVEERGKRAPR